RIPRLPATEAEKWRWASHFGERVTLTSVRTSSLPDSVGWTARYAFEDVRLLGVDLTPRMDGMSGRGIFSLAGVEDEATRLTFDLGLTRDALARVTVHFPRFGMSADAEPLSQSVTGPPEEMESLRQIMAGSRVT